MVTKFSQCGVITCALHWSGYVLHVSQRQLQLVEDQRSTGPVRSVTLQVPPVQDWVDVDSAQRRWLQPEPTSCPGTPCWQPATCQRSQRHFALWTSTKLQHLHHYLPYVVVNWLMLPPQGCGFDSGPVAFLCRVCMFSLFLSGFTGFLPQSKDIHVKTTKCPKLSEGVTVTGCLYMSLWWPGNKSRVYTAFASWQLG